jgi:hypothetical protein
MLKFNHRQTQKGKQMFVLLATKELNDGTKGFRFNFLGIKGLTRKRKGLSRGLGFQKGKCTTALHLGKRTVYFETKRNRKSVRQLRHFAG